MGCLYLPLRMNDVSVVALIDTRSTVSVVHPSVLAKIPSDVEVHLRDRSGRIRLADGSETESLGTVQLRVPLGTGKDMWTHEWIVAEIESPVVLGVDFLQMHQCTLDVGTARLTVGSDVHVCWYMASMPQVFRIRMAETVVIPGLSEMIVPGEAGEMSHVTRATVEGNCQELCEGNVMVAHTLLNPSLGTLPVRVMNLSSEPQRLHAGTHIAMREPVSDVIQSHPEGPREEGGTFPQHVQNLMDASRDFLGPHERDLAECLLSEFVESFAKSKDDLSITNADQHSITMVSAERVKLGPKRLALAKRHALKCELDRLLRLGVIEPSKSAWASPVVLVTKKDGSLRLCVDFRLVNSLTIKDSYPLPCIDDAIDSLRGSRWFSTLDLASGYWQVPMDPKDIEKTAFATQYGLYQF